MRVVHKATQRKVYANEESLLPPESGRLGKAESFMYLRASIWVAHLCVKNPTRTAVPSFFREWVRYLFVLARPYYNTLISLLTDWTALLRWLGGGCAHVHFRWLFGTIRSSSGNIYEGLESSGMEAVAGWFKRLYTVYIEHVCKHETVVCALQIKW